MKRRDFMATCAAGVSAAALAGAAEGQTAPKNGPFAGAPIKMSCPPGWFRDVSFPEQLEQIAQWGFPAYERLGPPADPATVRAQGDAAGLELSCIIGAGAIAPGHMVQPKEHAKVEALFRERVAIAKKLGCKRLIGLSGNTRIDATHDEQMKYMIRCVERLAPIAEDNDVILVLEALNTLVNHKGYFLTRTDQTMLILEAVDSPNVKMLFDIYHQQITEGNIIRNIRNHIDRIGHFHVGDNPGRREPGSGELNYTNIFRAIAESGYDGFVALECGRTGTTEQALEAVAACLQWD